MVQIEILSSLGFQIKSLKELNNNTININISSLTPGIYNIKAVTVNGVVVYTQFIKSN